MHATVRRGSDGTVGGVDGGYESWFVSARDPAAPRALWLRHTRFHSSAALWCTLFEPEPVAVKQSVSALPHGAPFRGAARAGTAAYELGGRDAAGPVPLQPYPDP
jgi:hypothetical protein